MEIKPFTIAVPDSDVDDLFARLRNTRWPWDVVSDWSRGVPTRYAESWPTTGPATSTGGPEAALNAFPQFTADVDGQTIHFVHVRSTVPDATPLLILHGYPSSFVEFTRMIGPLVDPEAHGGRAEDAFHVVVPSLPGFGFSTPGRSRAGHRGVGCGVRPDHAGARLRAVWRARRRHRRRDGRAAVHPGRRSGHRLAGRDRPRRDRDRVHAADRPSDRAEQERHQQLKAARAEDFGYIALQTTRPQSIAYGLTDSPVAQLTWIVEKFKEWTDPTKELPEDAVDLDQLLTLVSVYWFGKGGAGAANFLYEAMHAPAAWGQTHDRPQGFVAFGEEPLIRRILDPGNDLRTGMSTPRAATSRRWRCRTCWSTTFGRSSRRSAELDPGNDLWPSDAIDREAPARRARSRNEGGPHARPTTQDRDSRSGWCSSRSSPRPESSTRRPAA